MKEIALNQEFTSPIKISKFSIGIFGGLIIGVIYVLLLSLKYYVFSGSFISYTTSGIISYLLILGCYVGLGFIRRNQLGQFSGIRDIYISILIAVVITEGFYVLFNFIYLKYMNPGFGDHYISIIHDFFIQKGLGEAEIAERSKAVKLQYDDIKQSWNINLFSWATWVIIDGIIGLMVSMFLRRARPQNF